MTTRSYPTTIYEADEDGAEEVHTTAHASTIDSFAVDDEGRPSTGADGVLGCFADVRPLRLGHADMFRDGKHVGSVNVEMIDRSIGYVRLRCFYPEAGKAPPVSPEGMAKVGDEITQYRAA